MFSRTRTSVNIGLVYRRHFSKTPISNFILSRIQQQQKQQPKSNLAKLRKKTGYSISLCKKALEENGQEVSKAEEWLKEQALSQGWAKATKLEGRNTTQGLIGLLIKENSAAMIELNCETDFVARNAQFHELLNEISNVALKQAQQIDVDPATNMGLKTVTREELTSLKTLNGSSNLADLIALNIGQIGEKLDLRRGVLYKSDSEIRLTGVTHPSANIHKSHNVQYGRYGTIMAYVKDQNIGALPEGQTEVSMCRQLCQHIIGMNPARIGDVDSMKPFDFEKLQEQDQREVEERKRKEDLPEEPVGEGVVVDEESKEALKPTVDHEELINQEFLLDSSLRVGQVLMQTGINIKGFVRFEVGQEVE